MKSKILVTGGTGYIGSHTVVELQEKGYDVIIIDNLSNSNISVLDGISKITGIKPEFENFDLCDYNKLEVFFRKHKDISSVIHFAAFKAVGESVNEPLKYYRNNLVSLMNILELMKLNNISNLVFSSSCTVYGEPDNLPVNEIAPIKKATSPYGNTKQIAEEIIQDFIISNSKFTAIALRYFNPIGAHPSSHIGELPIGVPNNLVPFITQTAIGKREKLQVFGDTYNTEDGSCIRDYIDVVDLAKAHVISIERLQANQGEDNFEVFNLGTGKGVSVLEMLTVFEEATKQKLNYFIGDKREGDIEKVYADNNKAKKILGWESKQSLNDTLLSAWNWEQSINNY